MQKPLDTNRLMSAGEIQAYLAKKAPYLHLVQHRNKYDQQKIAWLMGLKGVALKESYMAGMDFRLCIDLNQNKVSKANVLDVINKCTPSESKINELIAFYKNAHELWIKEIADKTKQSYEYEWIKAGINKGERVLAILANLKCVDLKNNYIECNNSGA